MMQRLTKTEERSPCPIIYIGPVITQETNKTTLKSRHKEFECRHTVMYTV
jgi:hypothetical protein